MMALTDQEALKDIVSVAVVRDFRGDKEFRHLNHPLFDGDLPDLEELLVADDWVKEEFSVLRAELLLDCDNRTPIREHPGLPFPIRRKSISDRKEANEWILRLKAIIRDSTLGLLSYPHEDFQVEKNRFRRFSSNEYNRLEGTASMAGKSV